MTELADVRALAGELQAGSTAPGDSTYLRRGTVTAVSRSTNTYTVTIGGASVGGVTSNIVACAGDSVDVLFDGPTPRIIGVQGLMIWQGVTFQNGWVNYGGGYASVEYARDANGFVHLRGMAAGGSMPNTVFSLPAGYRPAGHLYVPTVSVSAFNFVQVQSVGPVVVNLNTGNTWLSFDNIAFPVA